MIIKRAEKKDLKTILDLQYLAYQSEAKLFNDSNIPPLRQTLAEVESEYEKGVVLKAVDENNTIIGSVRAYCDNDTVYIGKLMVHPEKQGQGIGTQLLSAIENECPKQRYELFTSSKSKKNIELYEKLGYKIFSEKQITDELKFVYLEKKI
ncbi:MAG: GNAT family N-acetyltransferase [Clostridium sp.]|nr:GNAT family N-acetyltransferase [Clostridium sp.]MCM1171481.1 GNAT family N-acetyltransferase [Clostridium sp.]MCM1208269.1 GNAT family N-acetyltransferase [Ruminococcus sp.]